MERGYDLAKEALVIPAKAGIQFPVLRTPRFGWIPAFAGMTERDNDEQHWGKPAPQYPKKQT